MPELKGSLVFQAEIAKSTDLGKVYWETYWRWATRSGGDPKGTEAVWTDSGLAKMIPGVPGLYVLVDRSAVSRFRSDPA